LGLVPSGARHFETPYFLVLDAGTPVTVRSRLIGERSRTGPRRIYEIDSASDLLALEFDPGGLIRKEGREFLVVGSVGYVDLTREVAEFYRLLSHTLTAGFARVGGYFYGPEARELARAGTRFLWDVDRPGTAWGLEQLQEQQRWDAIWNALRSKRLTREATRSFLTEAGASELMVTPKSYSGDEDPEDFVAEGLDLFGTGLYGDQLDRLTIPASYFGECKLELVSLHDSDLAASRFACCEWLDCDFGEADLTGAYIASLFVGCSFRESILDGADMRHSTFIDCDFSGACTRGTQLICEQAGEISLSRSQSAEIDWRADPGPVPPEG
jgi:hypothetical protein